MKKTDGSIRFPCSFPLKVIGLNTETFATAVTAIFERHVGPERISYSRRLSSGNKYLSITATFTARSKDQLDALYRELNDHDLVLMTL
jgi:putative lipoic acid-binding regulatory protein